MKNRIFVVMEGSSDSPAGWYFYDSDNDVHGPFSDYYQVEQANLQYLGVDMSVKKDLIKKWTDEDSENCFNVKETSFNYSNDYAPIFEYNELDIWGDSTFKSGKCSHKNVKTKTLLTSTYGVCEDCDEEVDGNEK